jgi:hypothetical protein
MPQIEIPYKPHEGQLVLHEDTHRYLTIVCGRRWGKTIFAINELEKAALVNPGQYWYIAPTYVQAEMIAWELLKYYSQEKIVKKIWENKLKIQFITNGSIQLLGADKPDRLRGVGIKGAVIDEFADIKRTLWPQVIRPTLADSKGWAVFLGTPKGKLNQLYEMFIRDKDFADENYKNIDGHSIVPNSDFKSYVFKTIDNPYIDPKEVNTARLELDPQSFRQEWEASFEDYSGIVYKEFNPNIHIIDIQTGSLKEWYNFYVSIDTGRHTAVSFMAINEKDIAYVFDEIYVLDWKVEDICILIRKKLKDWNVPFNRVMFIIDSASQAKKEYETNKIFTLDSKKDLEGQISHVRSGFYHEKLFFNKNTCKMHIIEHMGYTWNEKSQTPMPVKENDHTCSSVQYIFSTRLTKKAKNYIAEAEYKKTLEYANIHSQKNKGFNVNMS